jgi:hypothetical protein
MIALWTKLTTSVVMIVMFIFFIFLQKGSQKFKFTAMSALLAGIVGFTVSWYLYCGWNQIPFVQPFTYVLSAIMIQSSKLTIMQFINNIVQFTLWSGVFFVFLMILLLKYSARNLREKWEWRPEYGYLITALVIVTGYSLIGGTNFGFPKYQISSIALGYIAAALLLLKDNRLESIHFKSGVFILLFVFILQLLAVGDLIYTARYVLRSASIFSPEMYGRELQIFIIKFFIPIIVYGGFSFYICRFRKRRLLITTLLLLILGVNTALILLQMKAPYQKGYRYGGEGTMDAVNYILKTVPRESTIIAPHEIIYYAKPQPSNYLPDPFWDSIPQITKRLNSQETSCFVYSIASNTVNQVRLISSTNGAIMGVLHRSYCHFKIGSYEIWISNKHVRCT